MNDRFRKIDLEEALKMMGNGEDVYTLNEEENALCLFNIEDDPHCWKDIAIILLYTEFYAEIQK